MSSADGADIPEFSQYFRYTILDAGNTRKAKDIVDAVMHADTGYYLLCSSAGDGNYFAHAWGRTVLEALEHYHGSSLSLDNLHTFEEQNCFTALRLLPTTPDYFETVRSNIVRHSLTNGSPCHIEREIAVAGHRASTTTHLFFKGLRRLLRAACNEELDALKERLQASSDQELARRLGVSIRQIRDLRCRGSLCHLEGICRRAGIDLERKD